MNNRIQNDIKLLTLTDLLTQANALVKELDGINFIFLSKYSATIEVDPEFGQNSLLCFIACEEGPDIGKATCKAGDLKISFNIPPKPITEESNETTEEAKAA